MTSRSARRASAAVSVSAALAVAMATVGTAPSTAVTRADLRPAAWTPGASIVADFDRGVLAAYTLIAPRSVAQSRLVVRAIVPAGASCPTVDAEVTTRQGRTKQRSRTLTPRRPSPATGSAFASVAVCQGRVPQRATSATIGGRSVPAALPRVVDEIALFGDTGCRIRGATIQDCASTSAWPLAEISQRVADERPDIVLNLGDFFYREAACPAGAQALCGGSPPPVGGLPFPDSDYGWLADAIVPMAPMLAVAPLVMLRGNHEACDRGGNGYQLFLDPRPDTATLCAPIRAASGALVAPAPATTPTWATSLRVAEGRTLRLAMVDSTYGQDAAVTSWAATQRPTYQEAADLTARTDGRESWLLTHRPLYGFVTTQFAPANDPGWTQWSALDQTAASVGLLDTYDLVLSSHLHLAQAVQLPGLPAQLVLGNGGTLLDPATGYSVPTVGPLATASGAPLVPGVTPYPTPSATWTSVTFGYAMAVPQRAAGRWSISHRATDGSEFARCTLVAGELSCADV